MIMKVIKQLISGSGNPKLKKSLFVLIPSIPLKVFFLLHFFTLTLHMNIFFF